MWGEYTGGRISAKYNMPAGGIDTQRRNRAVAAILLLPPSLHISHSLYSKSSTTEIAPPDRQRFLRHLRAAANPSWIELISRPCVIGHPWTLEVGLVHCPHPD